MLLLRLLILPFVLLWGCDRGGNCPDPGAEPREGGGPPAEVCGFAPDAGLK